MNEQRTLYTWAALPVYYCGTAKAKRKMRGIAKKLRGVYALPEVDIRNV
jgi:hypothetical protein